GNSYTFKSWDASEQQEYTATNVTLNDPYGDAYTGAVFPDGDGQYSVVELIFQDVVQQEITLDPGYQFISRNVAPADLDLQSVLANILNSVEFVKDSDANLLRKIGPNWVNGIGDWNLTEGYLIKMAGAATLTIEGQPVDPQTQINLTRTYQFIPYLPTSPQDAVTALSTILDNLAFAKDSDANLLRKIGPNWVNNIG
ncbi:hypothetical protein THIOM_003444, partial [Candidatus Thiomargarita nelsonii]